MARYFHPTHSSETKPDVMTIARLSSDLDDTISLTRVRTSDVHRGRLITYGDQQAHSLRIYLKDTPAMRLVTTSGTSVRPAARALQSSLHDLSPRQDWWSDFELDMLTLDIPVAALEQWRRKSQRPAFRFVYQDGAISHDDVIEDFARAIMPYLANPARAPRLFVDHMMQTMLVYITKKHGLESAERNLTGGLAPWQEKRAKELIIANLDAQVSLKTLADECRLSVSHFTKAFRQSTGQTPHQWLMQRRIDRAMDYLLTDRSSIAAVAMQCGFSDQAHFTNAFTKRVGASPGAWRRQRMPSLMQGMPMAVGM